VSANNPLLQEFDLPPYSEIRPEHVEPAIDTILGDNRVAIQELLSRPAESLDWQTLVVGLDELNDRLARAWGPVGHLNSVCNSPELRTAYEACLPKLSAYYTELGQNRDLFEAYQALAANPAAAGFEVAQKTILEHSLRDFRLSGIDLPPVEQQRFGAIQMKLAELGSKFSNQLLDATQAWTRHITDESLLAGITDSAKAQMAEAAKAKGLDGWLISLEFPSYYAVMTYADNRDLREEVYTAYCTRASDQGPNAGQFDNGPVMAEILELRHELAGLLGYGNFAELSLATKMAESTEQVLSFLRDLADTGVLRQRDAAGFRREIARDDAKQRGFAGAVTADETRLRSRRQRYAGVVDQEASGNSYGDVVKDKHDESAFARLEAFPQVSTSVRRNAARLPSAGNA